MYKIQTFNTIAAEGLEQFPQDHYEIGTQITDPDGILVRSAALHELDFPQNLKAIARAGAGVNNIPLERCTAEGIVVFNTPGANANAVKELVLAGLLLSSRGIYSGMRFVDGLESDDIHQRLEAEKKRFKGQELAGKTLGVVGLGAIGSHVANIALHLGMKVIGYDPAISIEAAWRLPSEVQKAENLNQLLSKSDYITLHVPAIAATKNLINRETLSVMKPSARLLNFARDSIVNSLDIKQALTENKLAHYVTDFPVPELRNCPGVLALPHLGASTVEAEKNCAKMAAAQLVNFIEHGNIRNSVNFPECELERTTGFRICFANQNVPKVLSQVLGILAEQNLNVVEMLNKSRDNIAYNLLDVETQPSPEALRAISDIDQVFHLRSL